MNVRESVKKNERKDANEKSKEGEGKKPGKMLDMLNKMGVTPLKATIAAVATTAVLAGCGSTLDVDRRDADEDSEGDAVELVAQMPRPPIDERVPMPRDAQTEGDAVEDVVEDIPDAVEDSEEEVIVATCNPFSATRPVIISSGSVVEVGGIGVRYNGTDSSGNGLFDILCGEDVVRSGIAVADDTSHTEDVSEYGFRVTLNPSSVSPGDSRVRITVDAY